ncbi:MAG: rod shape-determining protein RodA [Gammaproteobacteria bacterium]|nr:rod shape-determining protein RodA [Gammaproteobacteria bacterium]
MPRLKIDLPLFFGLLLLSAVSLVILWSAGGEQSVIVRNQAIRITVAFTGMLIVAQVRPDTWFRWSPYIYGVGMVMLLLVLIVGYTGKGAQRWLDLGLIRFQPSELMKIGVPMMLAWVLARRPLPPSTPSLFYAGAILALPAILILRQPDLGTTIMIVMSGTLIIFLAGFAWRSIGKLALLGAIAAPFLWQLLRDYQKQRILTLFDPWSDPLGAGYHSIQSMIAIGSGGMQGRGWTQGSQSQLEFIPERHTDFIFSVFSEEFGFIGVLLLFTLYVAITARGLYIAFYTQDTYSRLLAGSLSMTFFFYVFVNVGMVAGLLPVVGVPLPLISYGGTSMVTLMAGFGILMGIQNHRSLMSR